MKLLIINTVRFRLNGITSVIMNYYRNMDKQNMQVDFVVPNEISREYRAELESDHCNIFRLERKKNPLAYMIGLYRLMKKNGYDIAHIHGNSAMMFFDVLPAKLAGVPVRIVHSHNTTCSHMKLHKLLLPLFRRCYTHGFACGQEAGAWLFGQDPFVELKNGIDVSAYCYDEKVRQQYREKIGAGQRTVIGHIGNFIEQKNHAFLLDWFAKLVADHDDYLLILISDGALMEAMKEKASALALDNKVLFLGKTTEVAGYLQAMDMFVMPSLHEGLPVVLIEAQAAGLPCFVSDAVTRQVDLTDSVCFLPLNDEQKWIDAVSAKRDENARSQNCRIWQKKITEAGYNVTQNANRLKELYEEYCNGENV